MRCLQCCTVYCSLPAFWSMPSFPAGARLVLPQTRRCGEFSGCVVQAKEAERETGWRVLHWLLVIFLTVPAFSLSLTEPYFISHCVAGIVPALVVCVCDIIVKCGPGDSVCSLSTSAGVCCTHLSFCWLSVTDFVTVTVSQLEKYSYFVGLAEKMKVEI